MRDAGVEGRWRSDALASRHDVRSLRARSRIGRFGSIIEFEPLAQAVV